LHTDLDQIHKMEQMMYDITTLLSQFGELAQEQQDEVWDIHQTTADTKENINKGKDQLIDAKERTSSSHHYMAKLIFLLSWILLFFHWILP
jgi:t-SNARE complex subunit (syntaxin)